MGRNNPVKKDKPQSIQRGRRKSRPAPKAAHRNGKDAPHQIDPTVQELDRTVQEFEGAVEGLQCSLEKLREFLLEQVALGVRRDRLRRIRELAEDNTLDSLQRLATALESVGATGALPESLVPIPRMAVDHFCRAFEVQAVHQPKESLTVTEEQEKDFDWSADHSGERNFPTQVEVLRSGWKAGDAVFVLPRVRVSQPASKSTTST